jgi:predicted dehydrogenase
MKKTDFILVAALVTTLHSQAQENPLKIAVIGLTHTHVHWIFNSESGNDFKIVGIVEPNRELAQRYADQYNFPMDQVYADSSTLLEAVQPEAVTAFGSIYEHLEVVQTFAPLGIHVMVEKPLAVNLEHAKKMAQLARKHGIHLLTNYETTWYPSNHEAYRRVVTEAAIGEIRKVMVHDGHRGPKNIGVNKEFLSWLTDPERNGGGALTDFGCYGANLLTWLMQGKRPASVTALTQQLQAANNPEVEDEAIILLDYGDAVAIIQGSWNWPVGRKDLEIYGLKGAVYADNRNTLRIRMAEGYDGFTEETLELPDRDAPYHDPFSYFGAVVRGMEIVQPEDLSALENNLLVMEILDAARRSAQEGKRIQL